MGDAAAAAGAIPPAMAGLLAAAAAAPPAVVINWQPFDDIVKSLPVGQRGLTADLITEGSPLDAHATHSLGISPYVSDRLWLTAGLGQSSGADDATRVASWATGLEVLGRYSLPSSPTSRFLLELPALNSLRRFFYSNDFEKIQIPSLHQ